jgi:hypothetical protein
MYRAEPRFARAMVCRRLITTALGHDADAKAQDGAAGRKNRSADAQNVSLRCVQRIAEMR